MNLFNFYIHCTRKSEKHKQSFLCENYNRTFHNKSIKILKRMKSMNNLPQ